MTTMTAAATDRRRSQLGLLLTTHAMTDEQARVHDNPLIRLQARLTPRTPQMADVWLLNRMVVRHRELGWRGAPPNYGDLLAHRATPGPVEDPDDAGPDADVTPIAGAHRRDRAR
jgi:hypothetical protein